MNLRAITARAAAIINSPRYATLKINRGYSTAEDGTRVPSYDVRYGVPIDVQELSQRDILQTQGLNVGGSTHTIYLSGRLDAMVRTDNASDSNGGDLLEFDGQVWLVTAVLEHWADWTKVAATRQQSRFLS